MNELNDRQVFTRILKGDEAAAREFMHRYLSPILNYAFKMIGEKAAAEDATHETFLKVWQNADKWQDRGHSPKSWVFKIAHNVCVDHLRKNRRVTTDNGILETLEDRSQSAAQSLQENQERLSLRQALNELSERQRSAIILKYFEDLSLKEIATNLECSVEAVESLLSRGKRQLAKKLSDEKTNFLGDVGYG